MSGELNDDVGPCPVVRNRWEVNGVYTCDKTNYACARCGEFVVIRLMDFYEAQAAGHKIICVECDRELTPRRT